MVMKWLWIAAGLFVGFASCAKDLAEDPVRPSGNGSVVQTFTLELPQGTVVRTRADNVSENYIENICILVFDHATKNFVSKIAGTGLFSSGVSGDTWSFRAEMPMGTFDFVVLANVPFLLLDPIMSGTKDDVVRNLVMTKIGRWDNIAVAGNRIPMWGELTNYTPVPGAPTVSLRMLRMLAKIGVSLQGNARDDFRMTRLYYYNYNTNGYVVPQEGNYTTDYGTVVATSPSTYGHPGKRSGMYLDYSDCITGQRDCIDRIYVFEADHVAPFPAVGWETDTAWRTNPCLVIGGFYDTDTQESFYRVDFIVNAGKGDIWYSLLRNYVYTVNITRVDGPGYANPDEALHAAPMNMETSMFVTEESDKTGVTMDGPYMLALSETDLISSRRSVLSTTFPLVVKTNYPGGWRAEIFQDAACTQPIPNGLWLTMDRMEENRATSGTRLVVGFASTAKDEVGSRYVKFTAGRMSLVVRVTNSIALDFARSNVVLALSGGSPIGGATIRNRRLTFAVTERDNLTIPANAQGLLFRFGSLLGMSATTSVWTTSQVVYCNSEYTARSSWTWTFGSGGMEPATNVPYCNGSDAVRTDHFEADSWGTSWPAGKRYNATAGIGDVCAYISDKGWVQGSWRTPTVEELKMLWTETGVDGTYGARGRRYGTPYTLAAASNGYGYQLMTCGVWAGAGMRERDPMTSFDVEIPPKGVVFIPAGGYRGAPPGKGNNPPAGYYALGGRNSFMWSASSRSHTYDPSSSVRGGHLRYKAHCMNNNEGHPGFWPPDDSEYVRGDAMPIRCIRVD